MKIARTSLPADSRIARYPADYSDCFRTRLSGQQQITADELLRKFWQTKPRWVKALFGLRNALVKPLGLKSDRQMSREKRAAGVNEKDKYGFMTAVERTPDETIAAQDDKHLVAFISLYIQNKEVYVSTVVRFHNTLGRIYFTLIKPFHRLIAKSILRQTVRELEEGVLNCK